MYLCMHACVGKPYMLIWINQHNREKATQEMEKMYIPVTEHGENVVVSERHI